MPQLTPNLWFDTEALEAAEFYVSVFPNSSITRVEPYPEGGRGVPGSIMLVQFLLDGQPFAAINGGPQFPHSEAVSFEISCEDQAEVDHYWERLTDGGSESMCGWLKDRFGVSWQVVPTAQFNAIMGDADPERARRAMEAMFTMRKLDIAALLAAADGEDIAQ